MMPKIKQLTALRNSAILGLSSIVLSAVSLPAQAIELSSITGSWTSVNGGANVTGLQTNQVRWGTPDTPSGPSGLGFVGSAPPSVSFPVNTNFVLGRLTHYNFPIFNAASGANLGISLNLSNAGETINPQFNYAFNIDETVNQGNVAACDATKQISSVPCDDVITFDNSQQQIFTLNGNQYELKISGFSSDPTNFSPIAQFTTIERQESNAYLLGKITPLQVTPPTPVPFETDALPIVGSMIAFGFGLRAKQKFAQKKLVKFE
ncbi:THxN family PEP-CTERM protein [Dolichospermum flos-aquae]|uniref:THxN family PEP-CTERM protein n=1 Tax=Dolichospermum flos-aquae LEGE 04289 TaxID=1828708 RepID=A0ACC5Q3J2_DOLFA|nr:THxN family PEP-CTERM protein [Dolichospermum flos-aquae]MBE9220152.1 THxN family PEP-CTERM protein [Dolichospermum flos-aquae LEGE 04289]